MFAATTLIESKRLIGIKCKTTDSRLSKPNNEIAQNMGENAHHSTTLDTCMAQVGRERALAGSTSCKEKPSNGSSAAEAGPIKLRVRPAPNRAATAFGLWMIE